MIYDPWKLYDELIEAIPDDVVVTAAAAGMRWCRVMSSTGGMGAAFAFAEQSRPLMSDTVTYVGAPLREVATLAKSWNFVEAGIGMAAINACGTARPSAPCITASRRVGTTPGSNFSIRTRKP